MKYKFVVCILMAVCSYCLAQTDQPIHDHGLSADNVIDGAQHPELISDSTAYRLYFLAVSEMPNATAQSKTRRLAHLKRTNLDDDDLQLLSSTLETFKLQYTSLINQYNREAEATLAAGGTPDIHALLIQRDALVESTRLNLRRSLSFTGSSRLDEHIRAEKRNMKVGKEAQ
jgi:hypothetical protein